MSLLKRLVKNVKRAARKVLKNPVLGGVVSAIAPPLAPVIRTANTISAAAKVLKKPVIGGVVSAIAPPLAPVIRTANTISAAAGLGARRPPPPPPPPITFSLPPPMPRPGGSMSLLPVFGGVAAGAARVLPGVGRVAGGVFRSPTVRGVAGGAAGAALFDAFGNPVRRRRRSRGFSSRDIRQARRIVRLANDFSCPGTRMRKAGRKCR